MWSDGASPVKLASLVAQVHKVLPGPRPAASSSRIALAQETSLEEIAESLHDEPGFAWINGTAADGRAVTHLLHQPLATLSYSPGCALLSGPGGSVPLKGRGFDILQAFLDAWSGPAGALLVGYLSYELAAEIEDVGPLPAAGFSFPWLHFALYDSAFIHDEDGWSFSGTDAWRGNHGLPFSPDLVQHTRRVGTHLAIQNTSPLTSQPDQADFEAAVKRIVATIHRGDIFQTNLCRCIETSLEPGAEWALFQRLRAISSSRYESYLRLGEQGTIVSISPELFLNVRDGVVESRPIKGTRPRAASSHGDAALSAGLLTSEKDRAELAMIVDVVRNDLARVCDAGSVEVVRHAELMTLPTVHHLVSTVKGRLREGAGLVDLLRAAFPAASISGAPKIEAIRAAMREENQQRGPCMGAVGWIALDGRMEFSVAIRTAFVTENRVRYYAGCGITSDSIAADEFAESRHKAAAFVRALGRERDAGW